LRDVKQRIRSAAEAPARALVALGVTANALTLAGLLLNGVAGLFVALGALQLGGLLYLVFSSLDFLDGAVARQSGTSGPFGAFFDSVLDRVAEAVIFIGLIYFYAAEGRPVLAALTGCALTGSFMVSYARARAEGLSFACEVGWLQRPERIILLGIGLILAPLWEWLLPVVIGLLTAATGVTTLQRILHVARLASARTASRRS
jgi:CDP-diacylglycerol---glycerol-3-phosphate 3-phosphatidyltransferase